jgi:hypothetical protein
MYEMPTQKPAVHTSLTEQRFVSSHAAPSFCGVVMQPPSPSQVEVEAQRFAAQT